MDKLEANLRTVCASMKKDRDFTLAITGRKRRGKSTLAYHIAEYVKDQLNSKVHLCYNYKQLHNAMEDCDMYDVIFADEAISFLNKYQWNSPDATEFVMLYDMIGYKRLFMILVMPSFQHFVKGFREDRLSAHIWIPERGRAALYPVEENKKRCFFPDDPALIDDFPPLPEDKELEYRQIKETAVMDELRRIKSPEPRSISEFRKATNKALMEMYPDMTGKDRAKILGVTPQRVSTIDRELDIKASTDKLIAPTI